MNKINCEVCEGEFKKSQMNGAYDEKGRSVFLCKECDELLFGKYIEEIKENVKSEVLY